MRLSGLGHSAPGPMMEQSLGTRARRGLIAFDHGHRVSLPAKEYRGQKTTRAPAHDHEIRSRS
jgi:hypothetical protein